MAGSLADGLVLRGADEDGSGSSCGGSVVDMDCVPVKSLLDSVLLAMWEECAEQGLFRWVRRGSSLQPGWLASVSV
jgi:hypothetical protein